MGNCLHQKGTFVKRIVVDHETGDVADQLENYTTEHTAHEAPYAVADAKTYLDDEENTEQGGVNSISRDGGAVLNMCEGERAGGEGAKIRVVDQRHISCSVHRVVRLGDRAGIRSRWMAM